MKAVKAEIITIGDEILYGHILDTNSQWLSEEFDKIGVRIVTKTTIGDNEDDIMYAFSEAEKRADIVIITGGLGPTQDDLTKPCLAKYFHSPISLREQALAEITELFEKRGFKLSETNRKQAELPEKCTMISNKNGTAPGMWFERDKKVFVSLPGVPFEMKPMIVDSIIPKLQKIFHLPVIYHKIIKTIGIGESWLSDKIKSWEDNLPDHLKLAYLPSLGHVKLRLTATGPELKSLEADVKAQTEKLKELASKYIYGYDSDLLEAVVGEMLRKQGKTIATAESCTGGYLAHQITSIPGSSDYFRGGVIPYDNNLKISLLDIGSDTLKDHGAVSAETVAEMAQKVREKFGTDIGVASSGIAGPGGGTPEKPVGTIWIAYADAERTVPKKINIGFSRKNNIKFTSLAILNLVRRYLNGDLD